MTEAYQPRYVRRRKRYLWRWVWGTLRLAVCLGVIVMLGAIGSAYLDGRAFDYVADVTEFLDKTPPVLTGVKDITVYEGSTVIYRLGVQANDETDDAPALEVDASAVDVNTAGTYTVTYIARDGAGNVATENAQVIVLPWKGGYADLETIYKAVDFQLAAILENEMTVHEQVKAIYSWARTNLFYGTMEEKEDAYQAAYQMLMNKRGDCFGYYAVTKLMFDRLGIPNIDVRKVPNSLQDSNHYWSLVSIDGGENYYHFDATPRAGEGDDFCLVTDKFLDDYSQKHKNCHNRDASLYPATPKEDLK